jgi:hypothetical protein
MKICPIFQYYYFLPAEFIELLWSYYFPWTIKMVKFHFAYTVFPELNILFNKGCIWGLSSSSFTFFHRLLYCILPYYIIFKYLIFYQNVKEIRINCLTLALAFHERIWHHTFLTCSKLLINAHILNYSHS